VKRRLGCLSTSGIVAALSTLVVLVAAMLIVGGRPFSPGPLNAQAGDTPLGGVRSHAETGGHCSACHIAFWSAGSMAGRCLACHDEIGLQLQDPESLHGALTGGGKLYSCRDCHSEHLGSAASLTIVDPQTFPHDATGYALEAHRQLPDDRAFSCADCHGSDPTRFDPAVCADCHGDLDSVYLQAHREAFGSGCLGCHDGLDTYGQGFDHGQTPFPLEGRHAHVACAECHLGARSSADLQATSRECSDCHLTDDAHDGEFGQDCAGCHTPEAWELAIFDHNQTAFTLTGRHQGLDCRDCHVENVYRGTPQDCYSCHQGDDAHDGQLGQQCAGCHTPEGWERATFDHNQAAFVLTGRHQGLDCRDCHVESIYRGTPQACISCHRGDDAHEGQFGHDCAACHNAEGWDEVTFDHSLAAFALTGAHLDVDCLQCHIGGSFRGTPAACADCHDEPFYHVGLLGIACADCHTTAAWEPARFDRAHSFPVNHGEGSPGACKTCHPSQLAGYTCYGCHEHDPAEIGEEHRDEGITDFQDCVRCHPTGQDEGGED
jgi:hypothetical protein